MSPAHRVLLAAVVGIAVLLVAALPIPLVEMLTFPGLLLASIFWPQGIHTGVGLGPVGVALFFATFYLGTAGFWGGVTYAILKRKRSRTGKRS